jgi:predicted RNase H-like nuclease
LREAPPRFPAGSAALERLLAEPIPKDAAKDDLWVSLVVALAQEQLAHAFADETLD